MSDEKPQVVVNPDGGWWVRLEVDGEPQNVGPIVGETVTPFATEAEAQEAADLLAPGHVVVARFTPSGAPDYGDDDDDDDGDPGPARTAREWAADILMQRADAYCRAMAETERLRTEKPFNNAAWSAAWKDRTQALTGLMDAAKATRPDLVMDPPK